MTNLRSVIIAVSFSMAPFGTLIPQSPFVTRAPHRAWKTVTTAHFVVHYPDAAREFAACLVPRLEAMHERTAAIVGWSPRPKTTIVIDDPHSASGGFASANARAPVILLHTQPSPPRTNEYSDCTEMRMVHEYTHILQLARPHPPESGWKRAAFRLLPAEAGPVILKRSPWLREGYAEHVEGVATVTGRRYAASRPAEIRTLALADALPAFNRLDESYVTQYLVGGAFLDWLAELRGEETIRELWRRLASPEDPSFREATVALYGAPADVLYARFTALVNERALAAERALRNAGLVEGDLVRRLAGYTDDPAISRDGAHVAITERSGLQHVRVWRAADLAAPAKVSVATLGYQNAQAHWGARWMPDGKSVLVISSDFVVGNFARQDVYRWEIATDRFTRVTRGAAVSEVDPSPDGRSAAGVRCLYGVCDLVRIDLSNGAIAVIAKGSPTLAFARPRYSPDGASIAVTVQAGAGSRIALINAANGSWRYADPDDGARRYDQAFLPDGRRLVCVSEGSGIPNLEVLDLASGQARQVTRVLTAAYAPEPDPRDGSILYLHHTAHGLDLKRLPASAVEAPSLVELAGAATHSDTAHGSSMQRAREAGDSTSSLSPVMPIGPPSAPPLPFEKDSTYTSRPYGVGPRWLSVIPAFSVGVDGSTATAALWTSDIIGRLSAMLQGSVGSATAWRGAGLAVAWRGSQPWLTAELFAAEQQPSRRGGARFVSTIPDARYRGATLTANGDQRRNTGSRRWRAAFSAGNLELPDRPATARLLGAGELRGVFAQVGDPMYVAQIITLRSSAGRTSDSAWARGTALLDLEVGRTGGRALLELFAAYGAVSRDAPAFEHFALGGARQTLFDPFILAQRVSMPALPSGIAGGRQMAVLSATLPHVGPVSPWIWGAAAGESLGDWHRVIGVERTLLDSEARRNWRVPGARLIGGLGYSLDAPYRGRLSGYVSFVLRQ